MTTSTKPRRGQRNQKQEARGNKPKELRTGLRISVADLRVGMKIVTRWHAVKLSDLTEEQIQQHMDDFWENGESQYVAKSYDVKDIEECRHQWRTHIHINHKECRDLRTFVWIVKESS